MNGNAEVPITRIRTFIPMTEEMLMDAGYEVPGYWARELARQIARRRIRTRLLVAVVGIRWLLASIPRRARHVGDAILDRPCCEEDY